MKQVTATEARRNWFRLLDEVVAGQVVVIERKGRRIVLRREEPEPADRSAKLPDYTGLLRVPDAERAHRWRWDWPGPEADLVLAEDPAAVVPEEEPPGAPEDEPAGTRDDEAAEDED